MITHVLLKPILIFVGGAAVALLITQVVAHPETFEFLQKKSAGEVEQHVKEEVYKKEEKAAKSVAKTIIEKVLPAAQENPVLAPVFETKQEVEQTVETVKNLPEAQKNAICKQVCGE